VVAPFYGRHIFLLQSIKIPKSNLIHLIPIIQNPRRSDSSSSTFFYLATFHESAAPLNYFPKSEKIERAKYTGIIARIIFSSAGVLGAGFGVLNFPPENPSEHAAYQKISDFLKQRKSKKTFFIQF